MAVLFMERLREGAAVRSLCTWGRRQLSIVPVCVRSLFHLCQPSLKLPLVWCTGLVSFSSITNDDKLAILWLWSIVCCWTLLILKLCNMKTLFPNPWRVVFNTLLLPNSCCLGRGVITQAFYNFIEHLFMKHKDNVNNCHI